MRREEVISFDRDLAWFLNDRKSLGDLVRRYFDSSLERTVLASRICGVMKGFSERGEHRIVFSGAYLSMRLHIVDLKSIK